MDVEQFARRQPALFLGGALILGAVAARLLKASPAGGSGMQAGYTGGSTGYSGYTGGSTGYTGGSTGYTGGPTGVMGS